MIKCTEYNVLDGQRTDDADGTDNRTDDRTADGTDRQTDDDDGDDGTDTSGWTRPDGRTVYSSKMSNT